jgi:hypothetical protein
VCFLLPSLRKMRAVNTSASRSENHPRTLMSPLNRFPVW